MFDLPDIFERHGINTKQAGEHHHVGKGWIGVDCPDCSPDSNHFRLGFHLRTGRCNCWNCGAKNPIKTLAKVCGIPFGVAFEIWQKSNVLFKLNVPLSDRNRTLKAPEGVGPLLPCHRSYLRNRGFDPDEIVRLWGVQGIGISARLAWRLFIPIFDEFGRMVSWTTRATAANTSARYKSARADEEAVPHKSILYGAHLARLAVVVVEGPLDAWAIGPGAVATCGVGITRRQVVRISSYPLRIICFDRSKEAQHRAALVCEELSAFSGKTVNLALETGDDPAEAEPAEIDEIRRLLI